MDIAKSGIGQPKLKLDRILKEFRATTKFRPSMKAQLKSGLAINSAMAVFVGAQAP